MDRPILFSDPMVRALLDGRKTQTRRIVKPQPELSPHHEPVRAESRGGRTWVFMVHADRPGYAFATGDVRCPYGQPGDRLWVREAFSYETLDVDRNGFMPPWYWADGNPTSGDFARPKPSIHMPRWASRITLEIAEVRVERLQDISQADALAEGVREPSLGGPLTVISHGGISRIEREHADPLVLWQFLWRSINGDASWDANPWVWVVGFRVIQGNIDTLARAA